MEAWNPHFWVYRARIRRGGGVWDFTRRRARWATRPPEVRVTLRCGFIRLSPVPPPLDASFFGRSRRVLVFLFFVRLHPLGEPTHLRAQPIESLDSSLTRSTSDLRMALSRRAAPAPPEAPRSSAPAAAAAATFASPPTPSGPAPREARSVPRAAPRAYPNAWRTTTRRRLRSRRSPPPRSSPPPSTRGKGRGGGERVSVPLGTPGFRASEEVPGRRRCRRRTA